MSAPRLARGAAALARLHAGRPVALVPTMGALHAGHLSLLRRARAWADRRPGAVVCASVFVNPLQFGPAEDYGSYPRALRRDLAKLTGLADSCYAPGVRAMYPEPQDVLVQPPPLGAELCGASRPGFFTGVLTVVAKLLAQVGPQAAFFGEKDYQQLVLVRRMVRQLGFGCQVCAAPVVRERDGLALSSRNAYLSAAERARAPAFGAALLKARRAVGGGEAPGRACARARRELAARGFAVDYVECRGLDLGPPAPGKGFVVLGAVKLGRTRLIDNRISRSGR